MEALLGATFASLPAGHRGRRSWKEAQEKGGWWGTLPAALVGRRCRRVPPGARADDVRRAAIRRRRREVPVPLPALRFDHVLRRLCGTPAVAAGDARPAHVRDVEQLGGDQPADGGEAGHPRGRPRGRDVRARHVALVGGDHAGHRAGRRRHADGAGAHAVHALCHRPRREPGRIAGAVDARGPTGSVAWAATRVSLARAGDPDGRLVLFAGGSREHGHEPGEEHR